MLAGAAIQQKEKTIAAGLGEQLTGLAVEIGVEEHGGLHGVPVVHVVRRRLKIQSEFASVGIESHDGASIKIVAGAARTGEHRVGIASAPIEEVERRVVRSSHPGHAATVEDGVAVFRPGFRAGLSRVWSGVPAPLDFSGLGIEGLEEAPYVRDVSGDVTDIRGFLESLDPETGKIQWRWYTSSRAWDR